MRDSKGKFLPKHSGNPHGRPSGSGNNVKNLTWDSISKIIELIFLIPEDEMNQWIKENGHLMSRAEKLYLKNSDNLKVIEALLDRVIGKQLNIQNDGHDKNPLIERLYKIGPEGARREVQEIMKRRDSIQAEFKKLEGVKSEAIDTDKP